MSQGLASSALFLAAFLIGSIPFGLFVARAFNVKDIRAHGSGNIGATNVSRVAGFWPAGAITLLLDVLKGALPVVVLRLSPFQDWWESFATGSAAEITVVTLWGVGLAAVLGHCFSPWLRFKGGKGVATGLGVIVVLSPLSALAGAIGFIFCFFSTRTGSLSSLTGVCMVAVAYLIFEPIGVQSWLGLALISVLIFRHEGNIDALLESRERAF